MHVQQSHEMIGRIVTQHNKEENNDVDDDDYDGDEDEAADSVTADVAVVVLLWSLPLWFTNSIQL